MKNSILNWKSLNVNPSELRITPTLASGQCFTWTQSVQTPGMWTGVFKNSLISLLSTPSDTFYATHDSNPSCQIEKDLRDYFQLEISLSELYKVWSKDLNFQKKKIQGIRVLRQDPHETTFSFICTSNNNIKRITSMIKKLCGKFGKYVASFQGVDYYSFPSLDTLAGKGIEQELVLLGFGYRAKFVCKSAQWILENQGSDWLSSLRGQDTSFIREELMRLFGVGRKVADCISLMSMDVTDSIPVDTHVWQMAVRDYHVKVSPSKSLTDQNYKLVVLCFQKAFGEYAGWAHSVLFAADLKSGIDFEHEWRHDHLPVFNDENKDGIVDGISNKRIKTETVYFYFKF